MAALTGTVQVAGKSGSVGRQFVAKGSYTLGGALANADTITWTNLLPDPNTCKVVSGRIYGPELDTNATPTMLFTIGDGTDADGYLLSKGGAVTLSNSLANQLMYEFDGAIICAAAGTAESRNVVLTVTAAVATGATSGTIWIELLLEGV